MATRLMVRCSYVNATTERLYSEDDEYQEAFTDDRGRLFRSCQSEFGRCTSKIRADGRGDEALGWVFVKRAEYSDNRRGRAGTYLQETWVHVREEPVPTPDPEGPAMSYATRSLMPGSIGG